MCCQNREKKNIYNLIPFVPNGVIYRRILEEGLKHCGIILLVVRNGLNLDASGYAILGKLKPYQLCKGEESEWPGTVLFDDSAVVYRFKYVHAVFEIIRDVADSFCDWEQPNLPEDLCLLRSNEDPWFVTISHEQDCYFELTQTEAEIIQSSFADLGKLILQST
jgi:hypothetical protein